MSGTFRTFLIAAAAVAWVTVHVFSLVGHFQVSSTFDSAFATLVGAVMVSPKNRDKTPKD